MTSREREHSQTHVVGLGWVAMGKETVVGVGWVVVAREEAAEEMEVVGRWEREVEGWVAVGKGVVG